jgi:hypothetical protein
VLAVLHPLKPARRHAAGVGEDVGEHHDATGREQVVGLGLDRRVGRFDDDRCEELLRGAFPKAIEASLLFGGTMAMTREGSNVRDT